MDWKAARLWVLACVLVTALAGFAVLQAVGVGVWGAVAAGGLAVLGVVLPLVIERLRGQPVPSGVAAAPVRPSRLPTVAEVLERARRRGGDRWIRLGVHAAIPLPEHADPTLSPSLPHYVTRDADQRVREWLTDAVGSGGFLLLVGGSSAGKTRMAMEAIGAGPLLGWRFLRPTSGSDVASLTPAAGGRAGTVVWLDEVQNFVTGADALSIATVDRLLDSGRVILVGTIWPDTFDRLTAAPLNPNDDLLKDARLILQRGHRQDVPDAFSAAELERVAASPDPRLREAAMSGPRVTETLAAVPDLVRRWRHGQDEFGVLVVTAATLCRRAGHPDTLSHGLLEALTTALLSDRHRPRAHGDWFVAALAWAQQPVRGQSTLLWPVGATPGATDGYEVADALVQNANRDSTPPNRQLDPALWAVIIANSDIDGCKAMVSTLHGRVTVESDESAVREMIWRRRADLGEPEGMFHLAGLLSGFGLREITEEARQESQLWNRRAAEGGHEMAMVLLASRLSESGQEQEALDWYERAANQQDQTGRHIAQVNRAGLLYELGRLDEAEAAYRVLVDEGTWSAVYPLGTLLWEAGRRQEAEQFYRRAAEAAQSGAMARLGELAAATGRSEEAEHWYRQAIETGHATGHEELSALVNLGVLLYKSGRVDEGEALWLRAAEFGEPTAMYDLGLASSDAGRDADAERWWQQAADGGHSDAVAELGVALFERGDADAERWLRLAAEGGNASAMYFLAALLVGTDRLDEAEIWCERATAGGLPIAAVHLAERHAAEGRAEQAEAWFRRAHHADPDLLSALGLQAAEAGRIEDAEALYRRGAELGDTRLMTMLGSLLHDQENLDEAETWYRRGADQSEPVVMYQLGALLMETDRHTEAWDWIRRSAEGGYAQAASALAALAEESGDVDQAERWRQRAVVLDEPA